MMMQTWQTCTWLAVLKWLQLLLPVLPNRGMSLTEQPAPLVDQVQLALDPCEQNASHADAAELAHAYT